MGKQVTTELFGFSGTGRNLTEARLNAGGKIRQATGGSFTPQIVEYRGNAVLVWRELDGWHTRLIVERDAVGRGSTIRHGSQSSSMLCGFTDARDYGESEALAAADYQLAQLAFEIADGTEAPDFIADPRRRADFKSWAEFQIRYADARARGLCDHDAHSYAGRNPARPELWAQPAHKWVATHDNAADGSRRPCVQDMDADGRPVVTYHVVSFDHAQQIAAAHNARLNDAA